ncbi:MAG: peptidase C45 [Thermoleophilia bacterium]|nr:peptidase C45 [Thermoleophilia bacterium]
MGATYPHVRVQGGPRERGRSYGEQARERVRRSLEAYAEVFGHYAGWSWERVVAAARPYEAPIAAFGGKYVEELRGLAEGAAVPFGDVLALNVRTEVMFAAKARQADAQAPPLRDGCSAFAVLPSASANGHTLAGQNWDWLLHSFDTVVVLEASQPDAPGFVTVVEAGLLAKAGLNSSGLAVMTNALVTDDDRGEPGVPYHVLLRAILDAESCSDALATIQRSRRSSSASYLIAHEDGLAVEVEAAPGDFSRLFLVFPERGVLLHTNHFVSPSFDRRDVGLWVMPDSPFRLERLRARIEASGPLTVEALAEALADHANHPNGVCCHPDGRFPEAERGATVASLVIDVDARRLWLADGPPCTASYRELDCGELLAKPSLARARA